MDSHDQTRSPTTESPRTISHLSALCQNAFEDLCQLLPGSAHRGLANVIQDEAGRFQVWGGNIGAFQHPQSSSSLDSRLRHSKLMRTSVESGLQRLESAIRRAVLIVSGKKQNRTEGADHSDKDVTYQKAQRGLTGPEKETSAETPVTELSELFLNAQSCITNLFTLSMLIRRDRPRGRIQHHSLNSERGDAGHDITNVQDKFPKLKQSIWLAQRIGSSIMEQREYIRYRQSHRKVLTQSHGTTVPDGESILYSGQATTKATSFYEFSTVVDGRISGSLEDLSGQSIRSSATSYATTAAAGTGSGQRIPELTDMWLHDVQLNYNTHIECPYCRTIQMFRDRRQWKRHVYSDLKLYICTFQDCSVKPFSSSHEWFEHEMKTHRRQWKCYLCNIICQSPKSLDSHFISKHASTVPKAQRRVMIQAGEQAVTRFGEGACLLCNDWKPQQADANNKNRFQSHLEKHLQELARGAIPYIEGLEVRDAQTEEEVEPEESRKEDQASLESTSDPDYASLGAETPAFGTEHEEINAAEEELGTEAHMADQNDGYDENSRLPEELAQLQQPGTAVVEVPAPIEHPERSTNPTSKQPSSPPATDPDIETEVEDTENQQFETQVTKDAEESGRMPMKGARTVEEDAQKESWSARIENEAEAKEEMRKAHDNFVQRSEGDDDQRTKAKDPIKFKDAVGRKFSFPFHLCATWQGMDELITQAFLQVDVLGPHVQEGHYDLIGPNGEIILPSVWDKVIEPGWSITMTMWPIDKCPPLARPPLATSPLATPPPPGRKILIPKLPSGRVGVPTPGRRPREAVPAGSMPSPPPWHPGARPTTPADGIGIVTAAPPKENMEGKDSASVLTFLAGKPTKEKSSKK